MTVLGSTSWRAVIAVTAGVAVSSVIGSQAMASPSLRVQPHQRFGGSVNEATRSATIAMICFGPTYPGQTGHPMAGQHLGIFIPEALTNPDFGETGAHAHAIVARILTAGTRPIQVAVFNQLTRFGALRSATKSMPTALTLPCGGSGKVIFDPVPDCGDATPATVAVTFNGQP